MERFEHLSHLDSVVGFSAEYAEVDPSHVEEIISRLHEKAGRKKEGYELEKTEHDIALLRFINEAADDFMRRYGRKKILEAPLTHIHLLKEGAIEKLSKGKFTGGAHSSLAKDIIVERYISDVNFTLVAFHELMHLKSYSALQITKAEHPEGPELKPYRTGFGVYSRDGKKIYFGDFDEAVTEFLTQMFFTEYIEKNPLFQEELEAMKKKGEEPFKGRVRERERLAWLAVDLQEKNKEEYPKSSDIFNLFIDAHVNGRLLKLARLIEKTYGKGSFRELAEKT